MRKIAWHRAARLGQEVYSVGCQNISRRVIGRRHAKTILVIRQPREELARLSDLQKTDYVDPQPRVPDRKVVTERPELTSVPKCWKETTNYSTCIRRQSANCRTSDSEHTPIELGFGLENVSDPKAVTQALTCDSWQHVSTSRGARSCFPAFAQL